MKHVIFFSRILTLLTFLFLIRNANGQNNDYFTTTKSLNFKNLKKSENWLFVNDKFSDTDLKDALSISGSEMTVQKANDTSEEPVPLKISHQRTRVLNSNFALNVNEALKISFSTKLKMDDKGAAVKSLDKIKIGLALGETDIYLSVFKQEYVLLVGNDKYALRIDDLGNTEQNVFLILERTEETAYRWGISANDNLFWGNHVIESNLYEGQPMGGLIIPTCLKQKIKITEFCKGTVDDAYFTDATKAFLHANYAEKPEVFLKKDGAAISGISELRLNGTTGQVTLEELNGLNEYLIQRNLLSTNYDNTLFALWTRAYMMEWVYGKKKDVRMLNRLIEQSRNLINHRDDNFGKYMTSTGANTSVWTKGWLNFNWIVYQNDLPTKKSLGIASLGTGLNYLAATVRTIAKNPELWEESFNGQSYQEIAQEMSEAILDTWQFCIEHYYDSTSNLLISPSYGSEPAGFVPQWNRVFPIMCAGNTLVDAYELFGWNNNQITQIDEILQSMFDVFFENTRQETKNGKNTLLWPYGVNRWADGDKTSVEDLSHLGFDLRAIRWFHESGRYWNPTQTTLIANTLNLNVVKDANGTFANKIDGTGQTNNFKDWASMPPMIWLAEFESDLQTKLVDYAYSLLQERSFLEGSAVFHILHKRAKEYGIASQEVTTSISMMKKSSGTRFRSTQNGAVIYFDESSVGNVKIYDLAGRCVLNKDGIGDRLEFSSEKPGVYVVVTKKGRDKIILQ